MKECKGCRTFMDSFKNPDVFSGCSTILVRKADECPCKICLVKGVCITSCEEYKDFSNEFLPYKRD